MIFHLKILLDIMFSGYNVSPNRVPFYYHTSCISVRQPITEVKAEWNVAADVWEIGTDPCKNNAFAGSGAGNSGGFSAIQSKL